MIWLHAEEIYNGRLFTNLSQLLAGYGYCYCTWLVLLKMQHALVSRTTSCVCTVHAELLVNNL